MKKLYFLTLLFFSIITNAQITSLSSVCAGSTLDLTAKNQELVGLQNLSNFSITFYQSQANAVAGTSVIANPSTYSAGSNLPQTIFARITNLQTNAFTINSFQLVSAVPLTVNVVSGMGAGTTIQATGGTAPYQYAVNNQFWQNLNFFNAPLGTRSHVAFVRDASGCIAQSNFMSSAGFDAIDDFFNVNNTAGSAVTTTSIFANDVLNGMPISGNYILNPVQLPAGFTLNSNYTITISQMYKAERTSFRTVFVMCSNTKTIATVLK